MEGKDETNDTLLSVLEKKGKTLLFRLFHEMMENELIGPKTYYVFQVIMGLQILYYSFHDTFYFTWNEDVLFKIFRNGVKYFQIDFLLRIYGSGLIISLNIGLFVMNFIFVGLFLYMLKRMSNMKPLVGVDIIITQILSFSLGLFTSILVIPTFQVYLVPHI